MNDGSGGSPSRTQRILDRLDFAWSASGNLAKFVVDEGIGMRRFRPGGPHGVWIVGHLAFYERHALSLYKGLGSSPLAGWKERFGNGSECLDDTAAYDDPASILATLKEGRQLIRDTIEGMSDSDLDRAVPANERLKIRDVQSHIEFMIWHDSHHAAQLGAVVNMHNQELDA